MLMVSEAKDADLFFFMLESALHDIRDFISIFTFNGLSDLSSANKNTLLMGSQNFHIPSNAEIPL